MQCPRCRCLCMPSFIKIGPLIGKKGNFLLCWLFSLSGLLGLVTMQCPMWSCLCMPSFVKIGPLVGKKELFGLSWHFSPFLAFYGLSWIFGLVSMQHPMCRCLWMPSFIKKEFLGTTSDRPKGTSNISGDKWHITIKVKLGSKNWGPKIGVQKSGSKHRGQKIGVQKSGSKNWGPKIGVQKLGSKSCGPKIGLLHIYGTNIPREISKNISCHYRNKSYPAVLVYLVQLSVFQ